MEQPICVHTNRNHIWGILKDMDSHSHMVSQDTANLQAMVNLPGTANLKATANLPGTANLPVTANLPAIANLPATANLPVMANNLPATANLPAMANIQAKANLLATANLQATANNSLKWSHNQWYTNNSIQEGTLTPLPQPQPPPMLNKEMTRRKGSKKLPMIMPRSALLRISIFKVNNFFVSTAEETTISFKKLHLQKLVEHLLSAAFFVDFAAVPIY